MVSFCCLLLVVVLFFLSPQAALKLDFSWERPLNWITMQSNQTIFQWTINQIQSNVHWNNYCNHNIYSLDSSFQEWRAKFRFSICLGCLISISHWILYHIFNHFSTVRFQYANFDFILLFFPSFTLTLYQFSHSFSSFFHSYFFFCLFICLKSTPLLIFVAILFRY